VSGDDSGLTITDLARPLRADHDLDGLVVAFPDRRGGVSKAPFDSLNLGYSTGDDPQAVLENRRRFVAALEISSERVVVPGQAHGNRLLKIDESLAGEGFQAPSTKIVGHDVTFIGQPGIYALSLTADCPLVIVIDPLQRRIGTAHCGWRGTAAGALEQLLDQMGPAQDLLAIISPGIRGPRYPVGPEVIEAVSALPGALQAISGETLDLATILLQILKDAGLEGGNLFLDPRCSHADPLLFSHRRDRGHSGRGGCLVGWKF